jgi:hypothetical protein
MHFEFIVVYRFRPKTVVIRTTINSKCISTQCWWSDFYCKAFTLDTDPTEYHVVSTPKSETFTSRCWSPVLALFKNTRDLKTFSNTFGNSQIPKLLQCTLCVQILNVFYPVFQFKFDHPSKQSLRNFSSFTLYLPHCTLFNKLNFML